MPSPIQVKCAKCAAVLRFTPTAELSTVRCPKCQQQMRIRTPASLPPSAPTPPTAMQLPTGQGAIDNIDWNRIPAVAPQPYVPRPPQPRRARSGPSGKVTAYGQFSPHRATSGGSSGGNWQAPKAVWVLAGFAGIGVLLVAGLIALGVVLQTFPESKTTISLGGYAVDAPGKPAGTKQVGAESGQGVLHRRTNSEFALSTRTMVPAGQTFELAPTIELMQQQGMVLGQPTPVSRAGLEGYRITMRQPNNLVAEAEMFKLDSRSVLMLVYVSGSAKQEAGISKVKRNPDRIKALDAPDEFFASLRKE